MELIIHNSKKKEKELNIISQKIKKMEERSKKKNMILVEISEVEESQRRYMLGYMLFEIQNFKDRKIIYAIV